MSEQTSDLIEPKKFDEVHDNSGTIISVWEKEGDISYNLIDPIEEIIKLLREADEMVIIYSPILSHPEVIYTLEEIFNKGVRIYALTSNITLHDKSVFKNKGILFMREKHDIKSSFVLVDPLSGYNRKGLWFTGEITSQQKKLPLIIKLEEPQIQGLWMHFIHMFWHATNEELFYGKIRKTMPIYPKTPEIPPKTHDTFREDALDSLVLGGNLQEFWIRSDLDEKYFIYHSYANKIVLELNERMKRLVGSFSSIVEDKEIYASRTLPFNLMHINGEYFIFNADIGLKLSVSQMNALTRIFNSWELVYKPDVQITDLQKEFMLIDDNWDNCEFKKVIPKEVVDLGTVESKTIDDWINETIKPEFPDKLYLAEKIEYIWILNPPILPKTAKKHRLYEIWEKFNNEFKNAITFFLHQFDELLNQEEQFKKSKKLFIALKGNILEWKKEIQGFQEIHWERSDKYSNLDDALTRINIIYTEFNSKISQLYDNLKDRKDRRKKNRDVYNDEINELDVVISTKRDKPKNKASDNKSIDGLGTISKWSTIFRDLEKMKPELPLPSIGVLYEDSKLNNYLAIEKISEIELAKKEKKLYHAKIVVK